MERNELLTELQDVFRDILDDETVNLAEKTTANDVDGWDSLTHIHLVVAIEKNFKIKFTSKEILSWENVGAMMDCILKK
jgi:acyl carrier protein